MSRIFLEYLPCIFLVQGQSFRLTAVWKANVLGFLHLINFSPTVSANLAFSLSLCYLLLLAVRNLGPGALNI